MELRVVRYFLVDKTDWQSDGIELEGPNLECVINEYAKFIPVSISPHTLSLWISTFAKKFQTPDNFFARFNIDEFTGIPVNKDLATAAQVLADILDRKTPSWKNYYYQTKMKEIVKEKKKSIFYTTDTSVLKYPMGDVLISDYRTPPKNQQKQIVEEVVEPVPEVVIPTPEPVEVVVVKNKGGRPRKNT